MSKLLPTTAEEIASLEVTVTVISLAHLDGVSLAQLDFELHRVSDLLGDLGQQL